MKLEFKEFAGRVGILVDGEPLGYITNDSRSKTLPPVYGLHLAEHAPEWLRRTRHGGPYSTLQIAKKYVEWNGRTYSSQTELIT